MLKGVSNVATFSHGMLQLLGSASTVLIAELIGHTSCVDRQRYRHWAQAPWTEQRSYIVRQLAVLYVVLSGGSVSSYLLADNATNRDGDYYGVSWMIGCHLGHACGRHAASCTLGSLDLVSCCECCQATNGGVPCESWFSRALSAHRPSKSCSPGNDVLSRITAHQVY